MGLALLVALQAAGAAPLVDPVRFDLARHRPAAQGCSAASGPAARGSAASGSEIVVCGRRPGGEPFATAEMERRYAPRKIRAELSLGGTTVRAFTEAVEFPRGEVSKRIMVGIKLPF